MSIERNVAVSKTADMAFDLMSETIKEADLTPEEKRSAWERVSGMVMSTLNPSRDQARAATRNDSMSDEEAKRWERSRMPLGNAHRGEMIKDIPMSYLEWLADSEHQPFLRDLRRYLSSGLVKRERLQQG
jgi:hypothetical protein